MHAHVRAHTHTRNAHTHAHTTREEAGPVQKHLFSLDKPNHGDPGWGRGMMQERQEKEERGFLSIWKENEH